ncbi:hypothetical protein [Vulcaniibacterium gelatinicum]|uniref:hypothetical protein n=1 Tax=Vulcaniibacterium gelatinicum TaxID=2598725 RepID=UPI0011CC3656|nr:hypothetical protein [Vulcaniibacterium gelatinicum]
MNAILATTAPLPSILDLPPPRRSCRRHRIGSFDLDTAALDRFNALLARLGPRIAPLDCDQLATAARELREATADRCEPPSIEQRVRRIDAAARMIGDPQWQPAGEAGRTAVLVVGYAGGDRQLLPNSLPTVGRLDEAIVVEAAWPTLEAEVVSFLDFCRLRAIEAELRGCAVGTFAFTRRDWQQARSAEDALAQHLRSVRERSYVPAPTARFVIH